MFPIERLVVKVSVIFNLISKFKTTSVIVPINFGEWGD